MIKIFNIIKQKYFYVPYSRLKAYSNQLKTRPGLVQLQKTYSALWQVYKYISVTFFIVFICLILFAQFSYYVSSREDDESYAPIIPKEDLPFFMSLFLRAFPDICQALGELILAPDPYGVMDQETFSKPLDTQLRRNLLLRMIYLAYRRRAWAGHSEERTRDEVSLSKYSLLNKVATRLRGGSRLSGIHTKNTAFLFYLMVNRLC